MTSSIYPPSPFQIPYIKNAKLVKLEIKPFLYNIVYNYTRPLSFENEPYTLETSLLLENIWIHISSTLDIDLQLPLRIIHLFKLLFLNKKHPQVEHSEEQLTQSIFKFLFKKFSMLSYVK